MDHTGTADLTEVTAGTYEIDATRSMVTYAGKHMFGLGTVSAELNVTSGEIRVAESETGCRVHATIDAASFTSDNARRDRDVTENFLQVATHPDIVFSSSAVRRVGDRLLVEGTVTAHAHTVPVEVTVHSIESEGGTIHVHAGASRLDRFAFGITNGRGMVGRFLDLELDVVAAPGSVRR